MLGVLQISPGYVDQDNLINKQKTAIFLIKKCQWSVALLVQYYFNNFQIRLMKFKILCVFIYYVYFPCHFFACLDVWEVVYIYLKGLYHLEKVCIIFRCPMDQCVDQRLRSNAWDYRGVLTTWWQTNLQHPTNKILFSGSSRAPPAGWLCQRAEQSWACFCVKVGMIPRTPFLLWEEMLC